MVIKWHHFGYLTLFFFYLCLLISPANAQTIRFDPDPFIPQNAVFTVPLLLETDGHEVKGVESIISYDVALVVLDSISPGPWYTASSQNFFFWDYTSAGTSNIHFASAKLDGTSSNDDIIAYCHFSFIDFGSCVLGFEEVDVRDIDNQNIPFVSDNGLIILGNAVQKQEIFFGTLKAIYQ